MKRHKSICLSQVAESSGRNLMRSDGSAAAVWLVGWPPVRTFTQLLTVPMLSPCFTKIVSYRFSLQIVLSFYVLSSCDLDRIRGNMCQRILLNLQDFILKNLALILVFCSLSHWTAHQPTYLDNQDEEHFPRIKGILLG